LQAVTDDARPGRIELLDLWRAIAVAVMVAFHLCYDLSLFGRFPAEALRTAPARAIVWFSGGSFILISGTVLRLSHSPLRRGVTVLCCALAVTAVSMLAGYPVAFGALHLIGVCMLVFGALRERLERVPALPLAVGAAAAFALTAALTASVRVSVPWLYPLGLRRADFYSADYWPLLPWAFLYLLGLPLGRALDARRGCPLLHRRFPRALTAPGRHSLLIYLLHQPLIYGLCLLCFGKS